MPDVFFLHLKKKSSENVSVSTKNIKQHNFF